MKSPYSSATASLNFARDEQEFAAGASEWPSELSRRKFLKIAGASIALAGAGCTRNPPEHIVPYQKQPEEIIPGKPLFFASALTLGGFARGVLVETHEGRPTKIEGNPLHPASLGASDVFMQAELLTLYDPERSRALKKADQISTWETLVGEILAAAQKWKTNGGAGLRILTRHETSPTSLDQIHRLLTKYPAAKWHEYEPLGASTTGAIYHFDKAEVIVSLGADFLCDPIAGLKYTRDFANSRRPKNGAMNRLYVAESTPTLTGAMADHRLVMSPAELEQFARNLEFGSGSAKRITDDLRAHSGKCVVVAHELEAIAHRINDSLGNTGNTVDYATPQTGGRDLRELVDEIRAGAVETLVIINGNPVYDAPADFEFAKLLGKIPRTIHLDLYANETAELCGWHIPEAHELETWSDARAFDSTATIMQPMIEPLFGGRSRHELLAALLQDPAASSYKIVRAFWQSQHNSADFEKVWRKSLHDGIANFQLPIANASAPPPSAEISNQKSEIRNSLALLIRPSAQTLDGHFSNNAWLQEFPGPFTKIVWDNAALISAATAQRLKLESDDVVKLIFRGRSLRAPIWILPGQADDCVTVQLGYGRTHAGSVGNGVGFNAYTLRTSDALWGGPGLQIEKTGDSHDFVTTQHHWKMEGRDQVRVGTLAEFQKDAHAIAKGDEPAPREDESLYEKVIYDRHAWGMVIDLNTCIGCGACTIACQAENNIPTVGKEQVQMNREMHWIRVDRYFAENASESWTSHQPVPCMHCENAPCELVCPVAATVHSSEGLNQMVYNRCIGTRYCSNNCPYKVRRFNFLEYDANQFEQPATRKLMRNPNVSVRSRGVMEKCTYCIQRINAVKIDAQIANRAIRDGEITPACAQACPAEAIVFGDINDMNSRVRKLRASPLNYGLLAELNTRPRTTYLARLQNPNPQLEHA
ncbi:MAG: 4Fe-4S dicluster domain-containing protein [Verrucomicrobia bacterium]|nr:4Fe-4S dicluster domain-containing protein [Verrucomicrobiota bacterium]